MSRQFLLQAMALVALLVASTLTGRSLAAPQRCFPETTGLCIEGQFLEYWEQNGGLAVFGYPISPARQEVSRETGARYLTQWFERNRFELHPENAPPYHVLLGRLGDDRLRQMGRSWEGLPKASPQQPHYFSETGQAIDPVFWAYWSSHGLDLGLPGVAVSESLALFGLPIGPAHMEKNPDDGRQYQTQWFERARFEYHPEQPEPYQVLLGRLAVEVTSTQERPGQPTATAQGQQEGSPPVATPEQPGSDQPQQTPGGQAATPLPTTAVAPTQARPTATGVPGVPTSPPPSFTREPEQRPTREPEPSPPAAAPTDKPVNPTVYPTVLPTDLPEVPSAYATAPPTDTPLPLP